MKESSDKLIRAPLVQWVLKNKLGLTYRRLRRLTNQANSKRCLILRQQYAKYILDLKKSGKRVINVDETWINEKDYRRRCWRKKGMANSIPVKAISPNISMLVAVDTDGDIFFALT
jgi:hypothetical protein